ncbi:TetR/AcrR family transcriptional regulator [Aquabacter cavernae]|uniref:TetR/AcrR family transcriptional regulator n=1 Tax=Aquabacter cavernae TaxID=2496029 RepID=UPI000F8C88DB|nr:TetR/AcrR family transcriptional regulator [Aquabacter cavernae]
MARTVFEREDVVPLLAEVFRALGYEGASLSALTARTGLSKGSLYNFFPGGKAEMAAAVLAHVDGWFEREIFTPLAQDEPRAAIAHMWAASDAYFRSGRRVCLVGAFALEETRDRFALAIQGYFRRWIETLASALTRAGSDPGQAAALAEYAVGGIQGALVLARALNDETAFGRTLARLEQEMAASLPPARTP